MIGIIDYGMGNLRSVQKALEHLETPSRFLTSPTELADVDAVILPGVGAFRDAIAELQRLDFVAAIRDTVEEGRPLLGICLGLQLLFETSYEDGTYEGLGLLPGEIVRFESEPGLKVPHMGWNAINVQQSTPLLSGIQSGEYVYFVHSYHARTSDPTIVATTTQHGKQEFVSAIARDHLFATQFHPEKSQSVGLRLLENFAGLVAHRKCENTMA